MLLKFCGKYLLVFAICFTSLILLRVALHDDWSSSEYWRNLSKKSLFRSRYLLNRNGLVRAKNVILFLGDGMGMQSITAARLAKRQKYNNFKLNLVFDDFENSALIQTYNLDYPVPDSAATGTAFCSGVKAQSGTIGVNGKVESESKDCNLILENSARSVFEKAHLEGKSVGVVTTASVTDATPAATYAHVSFRKYQHQVFTDNKEKCKDVARQLIEDHNFEVVLGGGRRYFLPKTADDVGIRPDKIDLLKTWERKMSKSMKRGEYEFVTTKDEMKAVGSNCKYLFGLFDVNSMYPEKIKSSKKPSLSEMTEAAIKILQKNPNGFLLMVEGALIDKMHHGNQAYLAIDELLNMEKAIIKAQSMVKPEETLIITTADHSHSLMYVGYSKKDRDVYGASELKDNQGNEYPQLIYATGPGHKFLGKMTDFRNFGKDPNRLYPSAVDLRSAAHGGDDVAAYATGPGANLLRGTQEQTFIAHMMEFAACLGDYRNEFHCGPSQSSHSLALALMPNCLLTLLMLTLAISIILL